MATYDENLSDEELQKIKDVQKRMNEYAKKINDFQTIASTIKSDAPYREAFKIVFGQDRLDLDPSTPEGMRAKNMANLLMGKTNE